MMKIRYAFWNTPLALMSQTSSLLPAMSNFSPRGCFIYSYSRLNCTQGIQTEADTDPSWLFCTQLWFGLPQTPWIRFSHMKHQCVFPGNSFNTVFLHKAFVRVAHIALLVKYGEARLSLHMGTNRCTQLCVASSHGQRSHLKGTFLVSKARRLQFLSSTGLLAWDPVRIFRHTYD